MVQLIVGKKGTGKTKTLIEKVNNAAITSNGAVICIEKGTKLNYDVNYKVRLIDTDAFGVSSGDALYGFIAGVAASNHDITDIYVDSALKICKDDMNAFVAFVALAEELAKKANLNLFMTASVASEDCPESLKKYF